MFSLSIVFALALPVPASFPVISRLWGPGWRSASMGAYMGEGSE
jgi:hypothetical protein